MNILFVTNRDPRERVGGAELRTNLLWEALKNRGRVFTIVPISMRNGQCRYVNGDHPICIVDLPTMERRWVDKLCHIVQRVSGLPILPSPFIKGQGYSHYFPNVIMDIAVCRYIDSLRYDYLWENLPLFVDIDDHPWEVFDTVVKNRLPLIIKPIGRYINRLQTKFAMDKIQGGWIANKYQLKWCHESIKHLPNIPKFPSADYHSGAERDNYIFTIGAMYYPPNYQGVDQFIRNIWPHFHRYYPNIKFIIGGKEAPIEKAERWNSIEGVKYVGFIEDSPPTGGGSLSSKMIEIGDKSLTFNIWDTAGAKKYLPFNSYFFQNAEAIILVYDIISKDNFNVLKEY